MKIASNGAISEGDYQCFLCVLSDNEAKITTPPPRKTSPVYFKLHKFRYTIYNVKLNCFLFVASVYSGPRYKTNLLIYWKT